MAETIRVDMSGERRLMSLETTVKQNSVALSGQINSVSTKVDATQAELEKLKKDFEDMMLEQRKAASLQQASTELVTVRQNLEKDFGNYRIVRNTMLGILQATDSALVRKATVSTVSEELMISTPDYWLAPVLVALSAWIGNNRDLADRAIKEAVRRDNEHTSLVMALICRRNNRTATCYEWLSRYFATQDGANLHEDTMVYIDAYINGIFGPDEKHMCDDYVTRWIDEIRGQDSNFEEEQAETWNQNALRKAVDEHLVKLVSADDAKERKLREQERYLLAVKACQGDIEAARNLVNKQRKEEKTRTMNIVEQLTHIISDDQSVMPSQKKTAVSFLHGYINKGYTKYIAEKRKAFPEKITIRLNGWSGETTDGANEDALIASYNQYLSAEANQKKTALLNSDNSKTMNIVAIVLALAAVMGAFLNPILLILLAVAGYVFFSGKKKVSNIQKGIEETDKQYQDMAVNGRETIHQCCDQWKRVTEYLQSFESQKPETIVA